MGGRERSVVREDVSFVAGGLLRAALLHRQVRRVDDTIGRRPRRQLRPCLLAPSYLIERPCEVNLRILRSLKRQPSHVVVGMLPDEIQSCLVHFLNFSFSPLGFAALFAKNFLLRLFHLLLESLVGMETSDDGTGS